jgi:hypothetical protein
VKVVDIRFGRVDAEQVYHKARDDWKRQMNMISEKKKHADQSEKLKKKQETEKQIEQALDKNKGTTLKDKLEGK